ncbi:MAG: hypothetical protein ACI3XR_05930, partial [Eubacteriales bacterium]
HFFHSSCGFGLTSIVTLQEGFVVFAQNHLTKDEIYATIMYNNQYFLTITHRKAMLRRFTWQAAAVRHPMKGQIWTRFELQVMIGKIGGQ